MKIISWNTPKEIKISNAYFAPYGVGSGFVNLVYIINLY